MPISVSVPIPGRGFQTDGIGDQGQTQVTQSRVAQHLDVDRCTRNHLEVHRRAEARGDQNHREPGHHERVKRLHSALSCPPAFLAHSTAAWRRSGSDEVKLISLCVAG